MKTAYDILGLTQTASQADIHASLRRHAMSFHPDRVPASQRDLATAQFHEIMDAYNKIRDPQSRNKYDLSLKAQITRKANDNARPTTPNTWLDTLRAVFWPIQQNR